MLTEEGLRLSGPMTFSGITGVYGTAQSRREGGEGSADSSQISQEEIILVKGRGVMGHVQSEKYCKESRLETETRGNCTTANCTVLQCVTSLD